MKRLLTFVFLVFIFLNSYSQKEKLIDYPLPDSVRAVSFLANISVPPITTNKEVFAGIQTDVVKLSLESDRREREIVFEFPAGSQVVAKGIGTKTEKDELSWKYNWAEKENYKLMIATAGDSAGNFSLYSGYIFLPNEKKWKLIGTCKIIGRWSTIKQPALLTSMVKSTPLQINVNEVWCQRQNGSWKNMLQTNQAIPVVNLFSHLDSLEQIQNDYKYIELYKISSGRSPKDLSDTLTYQEFNGIHYAMIKEGTGKQVTVNDTVTIFYKGTLLDGTLFDETKERPATFPLKRLIMGWQIGVPLAKVGGKIRLIIPSNLAYSIRTRAAKIPPNSILIFEIEVVDTKSPL